jgi:hypothetical protein
MRARKSDPKGTSMTHNVKTLGLTALAALAMAAVLASSAQATPDGVFTVGEHPALTQRR